MPSENRVSATLAAADKTAILAALDTVRAKLPFLINLTDDERKGILKLGDKSAAFAEKCYGYMTARPELVPGFVNMDEVTKDRSLRTDLTDIWRVLGQLYQAVDDTMMVAGHEEFTGVLPFYQNVGYAAKQGATDAKAICADLSQRFPGHPKASVTPANKT